MKEFTTLEELLGDLAVVKKAAIRNADVTQSVKPVVAVDENDCSIRHSHHQKKPRRVAETRHRGG
jgi:hypothetical protein